MGWRVYFESFSRLFRKSAQKECKISEIGTWVNESWVWELKWSHGLRAREVSSLNTLLQNLIGTKSKSEKRIFGVGTGRTVEYSHQKRLIPSCLREKMRKKTHQRKRHSKYYGAVSLPDEFNPRYGKCLNKDFQQRII